MNLWMHHPEQLLVVAPVLITHNFSRTSHRPLVSRILQRWITYIRPSVLRLYGIFDCLPFPCIWIQFQCHIFERNAILSFLFSIRVLYLNHLCFVFLFCYRKHYFVFFFSFRLLLSFVLVVLPTDGSRCFSLVGKYVTGMSSNMRWHASAHTFFHLSFSHGIFSFRFSGSVFSCSSVRPD